MAIMTMTAYQRPDVEALSALSAVQLKMRARIERVLPPGVSATTFEVLERLSAGEGGSPAAIAKSLGLSRPAFSHVLARLQAQQWVDVVGDPDDGRRKYLTLTAAGAAMHRQCLIATRSERSSMRSAILERDAQAALPFLRGLSAWLTAS